MSKNNKDNHLPEATAAESASIRNSPLAMPRQCKAQQDIYRKALAEEEAEDARR